MDRRKFLSLASHAVPVAVVSSLFVGGRDRQPVREDENAITVSIDTRHWTANQWKKINIEMLVQRTAPRAALNFSYIQAQSDRF